MATQKEKLKAMPGKSNYATEKVYIMPGYARRNFFLWDENKFLYDSRHPRSLQSLAGLESYRNLFSLEKNYSK